MNSISLHENYYFTREYQKKSDSEFGCKISIKKRTDNSVLTSVGNTIDFFKTEQKISDSELSIAKITWESYLDEIIIMLFNFLIDRINLEDLENIQGKETIATYFDEYPFFD